MSCNVIEICRGVANNENNIRRHDKIITKLVKKHNNMCTLTGIALLCLCGAGFLMNELMASHEREIRELKTLVKDLTEDMEEFKDRKGA